MRERIKIFFSHLTAEKNIVYSITYDLNSAKTVLLSTVYVVIYV